MKIPPVRAELFDADGQTGSHEKTLFFFAVLRTRLKMTKLDTLGNLGEIRFPYCYSSLPACGLSWLN